MRTPHLPLALATLLLAGGYLAAEDHQPPKPPANEGGQDQHPPRPPAPENLFKELDTNGDGALSKEEFVGGMEKRRQHHPKPPKGEGEGQNRPPKPPGGEDRKPPTEGGEHRPKGLKPDEAFTKADANNDGKLTLEEMKAALKLMPRPPHPPRPEGKRDGKKDE